MESSLEQTADGIAKIIEPIAECFTPEVARKVAALRADADIQARIDELAEKCNEGTITPVEAAQYDAYVRAMDVLAILQNKARSRISVPSGS